MGGRLIAADSAAGALYSLDPAGARRAPLPGAAALCAHGAALYCASKREDVIWRLDARTLCPQALFAGGPNVTRLIASPGRLLAVAGGGRCEALVLDARTLRLVRRVPLPGPAADVAFGGGMLYALHQAGETAGRVVALRARGGMAWSAPVPGLPGGLCAVPGGVLAGAEGVSCLTRGGALWRAPMEGLCERVLAAQGRVLLSEALQGGVYALTPPRGGCEQLLPAQADDLLWYTDAP